MSRVGAAREIALVTEHSVIGVGPSQPWDHAVFELVSEQMRRHGPAAGRPGQARSPEGPVTGRGHPADPGPALIPVASIAFGFEPGDHSGIVEPGPPQTLGDPDRLRLTDQRHLECRRCGNGVRHPRKRQRSIADERHHSPPEISIQAVTELRVRAGSDRNWGCGLEVFTRMGCRCGRRGSRGDRGPRGRTSG